MIRARTIWAGLCIAVLGKGSAELGKVSLWLSCCGHEVGRACAVLGGAWAGLVLS